MKQLKNTKSLCPGCLNVVPAEIFEDQGKVFIRKKCDKHDEFKDIYMYAYEQGLKGCTTFRFNPEAFQGVLVKEQDLENTMYRFTLDDGTMIEAKGNEEIEYDGEMHTAANLFDALKEGYYGKF